MKKSIHSLFVFVILFGVVFTSCQEESRQPLRIAISKEKPSKYTQNYAGWLKRFDAGIEWINVYPLGIDSAGKLLETCDGVLITGGEDVYPGYYNKAEDTIRCGTIDRYRDSLEIVMISTAINNKIPLIGVCRGLQIINVALDGSLIIDIPSDYGSTVNHRQEDWQNCFHPVFAVNDTKFYTISDGNEGDVASNHHQGIDILGNGLRISAYASDSLPEAIEWADPDEKGFLMAVQWHPERMDTLHHLSAPIAKEFLKEATIYQEHR